MENKINDLWEYAESKNKKLYNWMNKDRLSGFIIDNGVFWFEMTSSIHTMPCYIFDIIKKYGERNGLKYLGDIPCRA